MKEIGDGCGARSKGAHTFLLLPATCFSLFYSYWSLGSIKVATLQFVLFQMSLMRRKYGSLMLF